MTARIIAGIVIGGSIGFAVGYLARCASGTCPLTSSPVGSTLVGAGLGLIIATLKK